METDKKIRILLVEDDEIDVRAFERTLRKSQIIYQMTTCVYASDALSLLDEKSNGFDCIFIDYQLPGMDGLTLLKNIMAMGYDQPVLVMTSQGDEKIAVEMMKQGAFDYFPKSDLSQAKIANSINAIKHYNTLSSEKRQIRETLDQQKIFTEAITHASPNIIYVYNICTHKYIYVNRSIFTDLGYSKSQISEMGRDIFDLTLNPDHALRMASHLKILAQATDDTIYEAEYQMKNVRGEWVWYYNRDIVFKRDENRNPMQILGAVSNISNIKKVESDLRLAKQEAEKAALVKSEFLSNMSHEIRTPMNAIIGLTDLLLNEKHKPFVEENLKSIKQSADNLLVIINDILDFSKIEAGKMEIEAIDFNIKYQLEHIGRMMGYKANEKKLAFETRLDPRIPEFIIGDPFRLNQIIINLTGNAIKFTSLGFVKIEALLYSGSADEIKLKISVKDSGIGIAKEKQKSIFESFTQAGSDTARFFGGTGLGLTITSQLVRLMNGQISVESTPDLGSEFSVIIPFKIGSRANIVHESQSLGQQDISGLKILVVEDNRINQKVISQILKSWNCGYAVAGNGREGLKMLASDHFDLVLMDLQMPVLDGFEATRLIRKGMAGNAVKDIPIIALTADAFPETKKKVMDIGMSDFVSKPFKQPELNNKIHRLARRD